MHTPRVQYAPRVQGGRNAVLIRISVELGDTHEAWVHDDESQYLFASDTGSVIGKTYGAINPKYGIDNRNPFVVGPDGKIAHVMAPFREIDPQAYKELAGAIDRVTPKTGE